MRIRASTSEIASVAQTDMFLLLLYDLRSPSGRGTPDISAQALQFRIIRNGVEQLASGTSASTPVRLSFLFPPFGIRP